MPDNNNSSSFSRYFKFPSTEDPPNDTKKHLKLSKAKSKWLHKMTLEVNKVPYSNSKNLGLYQFDRCELEWYYKELRLLVDKTLDILECPYCEDTVKMVNKNKND